MTTTTPRTPRTPRTPDQLRAAIPGWGVDSDWSARPAVPRELPSQVRDPYGDDRPPQQQPDGHRERSVEHARLTPVFGTSCPTRGLSGVMRRLAYARWSEGRTAHWLTLMAADRVDVGESSLRSWAHGRPDLPFVPTGLRAEATHHGVRSRVGQQRTDVVHQALDPLVVVAPWALLGAGVVATVRAVRRRR